MREFPHIQKVYAEFKDKGLEVLGVNFRSADPVERIVAYQKDNEYTFKMVQDVYPEGQRGATATDYSVRGAPTNFLIGKDGKFVRVRGMRSEAQLREALAEAGIK